MENIYSTVLIKYFNCRADSTTFFATVVWIVIYSLISYIWSTVAYEKKGKVNGGHQLYLITMENLLLLDLKPDPNLMFQDFYHCVFSSRPGRDDHDHDRCCICFGSKVKYTVDGCYASCPKTWLCNFWNSCESHAWDPKVCRLDSCLSNYHWWRWALMAEFKTGSREVYSCYKQTVFHWSPNNTWLCLIKQRLKKISSQIKRLRD